MHDKKGFTLVELLVVLLILGILMSVAVVVFLGARNRAQDNVAQQALANASRAVAAYYALENIMPADKDEIYKIEGSYIYTDEDDGEGAPNYTNPPSIAYDPNANELRTMSESDKVWVIGIEDDKIGKITEE